MTPAMTPAWIGFVVVTTAIVALATQATARAARLLSLPSRWIWSAGLLVAVGIAGRAPLRAGEAGPLRMTVQLPKVTATVSRPPTGVVETLGAIPAMLASVAQRTLASANRATPTWLRHWALSAVIAIGAAAVLALIITYARFAIARRKWPLGVVSGVDVRVAPALGPAVVGVARPEIVVPAWLLERSAAEQALVVAHEAEHLRARDPLLLALGWLTVAILPWNPFAWWMLARLRLAVELDCDARLLRRGVMPREYGTLLIDLAGRCAGPRVPLAGLPALAGVPSHLERRLLAMRPDRHRFILVRAGALGALALIAGVVACESKLPTSAEVQRMDVASAEKSAAPLLAKRPMDSLTTFYINGVQATAAEAHALPPERIATMMVRKVAEPQARSEIRITTRDAAHSATEAVDTGRVMVVRTDSAGSGARMAKKLDGALVYVDGVRADRTALESIDRNEIVSVEVLKGEAAVRAYADPAAANGVISITTRKSAKP